MEDVVKILKQCNLLYAEDNLAIQETTKKTLEFLFANVYTANDGKEALEIFKSNKIDVVLADYIMPNMDGFSLAKNIIEIKNIPIIVSTGYDDKNQLLDKLGRSSNEFIKFVEKPLQYDQLIDVLKSVTMYIKKG